VTGNLELKFHFEILRLKKCHLVLERLPGSSGGPGWLVRARGACSGTPNTSRGCCSGRGRSRTLRNHPTRISYGFPGSLASPERPGAPSQKKTEFFFTLRREVSELQNWTHMFFRVLSGKNAILAKTNVCDEYVRSAGPGKCAKSHILIRFSI
jgi:hypothetical protein